MVLDAASPVIHTLPLCAVCGRQEWTPRRGRTRLRACKHCGTFLNDRSVSRAEEESRYGDGSAVGTQDAERVAIAQFKMLADAVGKATLPDRSVLDIGCGRGDFLCAARAQGWRTAGLEIDPVSAAACHEHGLEVRCGSLFDTAVPPGPWSVITFWDVLDHLEDPRAALRLARAELAPGGMIIVRGRNAAVHSRIKLLYASIRPLAERFGAPDLSVVHRWGILPGGWLRLLENSGFRLGELHPGVPTPGDRYASLGSRRTGGLTKAAAARALFGLYHLSFGRVYPFPSVVVSGRG